LILSVASLEVHSSCYVPIQFDHVTLSIIKFIVAWPNFSTCLNEIIVIQHVNKVCTTNKHQFELGLTGDSTAQVAKWKEEVKLWESDKKKPNPFEVQVYCKLFLSWCRCWGCLNNDYKPWHSTSLFCWEREGSVAPPGLLLIVDPAGKLMLEHLQVS